MNESELYCSLHPAFQDGYYLSHSLDTSRPDAWYLAINDQKKLPQSMINGFLVIRPLTQVEEAGVTSESGRIVDAETLVRDRSDRNPFLDGDGRRSFNLQTWGKQQEKGRSLDHFHLDLLPKFVDIRDFVANIAEQMMHSPKKSSPEEARQIIQDMTSGVLRFSRNWFRCRVGSDGFIISLGGQMIFRAAEQKIIIEPEFFGSEALEDTSQNWVKGLYRTSLSDEAPKFLEFRGPEIDSPGQPARIIAGVTFNSLSYQETVEPIGQMIFHERTRDEEFRQIVNPYLKVSFG